MSAPRPGVEIAAMAALLLSYIWIWQDAFPLDFYACLALYLALGIRSHSIRRETTAGIGVRLDNLVPATWLAVKVVAPLAAVAVLAGMSLGTSESYLPNGELRGFARAWIWGTLQQYGLACFFFRRFRELLGSEWRATFSAAALFALFHVPNPFLVPVTFTTGIVTCWLYRREPNVFVLGAMHVLLSFVLRQSFGAEITHHMKVGPGYLNLHR